MADYSEAEGGQPSWHRSRGDLLFAAAVIVGYIAAMLAAIHWRGLPVDRMMTTAESAWAGHLDSPTFKGAVDTVYLNGRYYVAVGPLQLAPYLPFAPIPALHSIGGMIAGIAFGIPAALLALPLARTYGARGNDAYWVACFIAFGTLLFYVSVFGDFYYLAAAQSFLALSLFLIEWARSRRPVVLGLLLAFSLLARPTTVLMAIPFGLALLWPKRHEMRPLARSALAFGLPIALAIGIYAWYNWLRFGSPLETGYAISSLPQPGLEARRELGIFSILQVPENLRLALLAPFDRITRFPYLTANPYGLSMLLVSPALLTALWAGFHSTQTRLLWAAIALVAIPDFLYYGGGYVQYGYRYSLDFTPMLVALVALGSVRWAGHWSGRLERLLIAASIASVSYGVLWHDIRQLRP